MEYVIANVGYFLELWMIQIYAELIWKQKFCFRGFSCALFVINGIVLTGVNLELVPDFFVLFVHILLYAYLWKRYKGSIKENLARTCAAFVLAWGTEIVSGVLFYLLGFEIEEHVISLILINSISLFLSVLIKIVGGKKRIAIPEKRYYTIAEPILVCALPLSVVLVAYFTDHKFKVWYNLFGAFFVLIVIVCLEKIQKTEYEKKQKELELNINGVYGDLYEDVISDIRRKQHNYKEQIAAIYSSHKTAQSMEELVKRQKEYCDMLLEDSEYDFILTSCNEPILAGFVYYKCLDGLKRNVKVECNIRVNQWNSTIKLYELIEVLGIFFNNAFEYVTENDLVDKVISFTFVETEESYYMSISNEIVSDLKLEFSKMFEMEYSTKGEGRGLGLPRARQICNRYGFEIKVGIERDERVRIKFEIDVLK